MKKKLTLILLFGFISLIKAQDINISLYKAVVKDDLANAQALIQKGADVNYVKEAGTWMAVNLLITAISNNSIKMSSLLLKNKVDVNWKDGFQSSAIIYAAGSGNTQLFDLILKYGADIHDVDEEGHSVLSAADESKNPEMVKLVFKRINEAK